MKRLKPHPHVIRLSGCVTETGGLVLYFLFCVCLEYTVGHYNLCVLQRISNVLFFLYACIPRWAHIFMILTKSIVYHLNMSNFRNYM